MKTKLNYLLASTVWILLLMIQLGCSSSPKNLQPLKVDSQVSESSTQLINSETLKKAKSAYQSKQFRLVVWLLSQDKLTLEAQELKAKAFWQLGELDEAVVVLQDIKSSHPDHFGAAELLSRMSQREVAEQ